MRRTRRRRPSIATMRRVPTPGKSQLSIVRWRRSSISSRGLSRPTTVVVTSDHGEALGDHGETTHGLFAYEPTLRVPLIVSRVAPGGNGVERAR